MELRFETVLKWINTPFFQIGQTPVTLSGLSLAFLIVVAAFFVSGIFQKIVLRQVSKKFNLPSGLEYAFRRILHYVIILLGIMVAAQCVGLNFGSLAVIFGFLSVGIGFGLQNITSTFLSGLILLLERPIAVGDFVRVEGEVGRVEQINMRATVINTLDNVRIIVPNSKFIESAVLNWSHTDPRVQIHCPVGVAYGSNISLVKETLLQVALNHESVLKNPEPEVRFLGFGDSSLDFDLLIWTSKPSQQLQLKSDINFKIDEAFRKNEITIPFPQRDLHLKLSEGVQLLAKEKNR